jgi:hypothetical protein
MNFLSAILRSTFCALLALHGALATAAELDPEMRKALRDLVAAQKLEQSLPPVFDNARRYGIEQVRQGAARSIEANTALSEAERARARKIMDELAPQLAAGVDADLRKLDAHALALGMVESVYPKYYTVEEVRQLAAYYATPAYQKMTAVLRMVNEEHARSGKDKQQLWRLYVQQVSVQEDHQVAAFMASPLGKKVGAIGAKVSDEGSDYLRRQIAPVFAAAAAAHRQAFQAKLAEVQAH